MLWQRRVKCVWTRREPSAAFFCCCCCCCHCCCCCCYCCWDVPNLLILARVTTCYPNGRGVSFTATTDATERGNRLSFFLSFIHSFFLSFFLSFFSWTFLLCFSILLLLKLSFLFFYFFFFSFLFCSSFNLRVNQPRRWNEVILSESNRGLMNLMDVWSHVIELLSDQVVSGDVRVSFTIDGCWFHWFECLITRWDVGIQIALWLENKALFGIQSEIDLIGNGTWIRYAFHETIFKSHQPSITYRC